MPAEAPLTPFAEALVSYGLENCLINDSTLWVGADGTRDWPVFRRVPRNPPARRIVDFLDAPSQADLVSAFVASPEAQVVEQMLIGTSPERRPEHFEMAAAVAALKRAHLPALRTLELGDMQNLYGGFRQFGTVGDIGHVFAAAPNLRRIGIYGNFVLGAPVHHDTLEHLFTQFDDVGSTGEPITQLTLDNLVTSSFPALVTLHLDLDEGGADETLMLPDAFFSPGHLPSLRELDIDRLVPGAKASLDAYRKARGLTDASDAWTEPPRTS